jgi:hypothetical protein
MRNVWALLLVAVTGCGAVCAADGGFPPSDAGLDLNDVSFLYPLPAVGHFDELTGLEALLPRALYDGLPALVEGEDASEMYGRLKVLSVRVDPCFPGSTPPAAPVCVKQLRLVAQPVIVGGDDAGVPVTTEDATVHLFYQQSDASFAEVENELWALKDQAGSGTDGQPLQVNPVLARQGLTGAYAQALGHLVLAHCSAANLTRVAFMSVSSFGTAWRFGAFDVQGGALVAAEIPRTNGLKVQGFQEFGSESFRNGQLLPSVAGDDLDVLLSESQLRLTDTRTLDRALGSALTIEHPAKSSPKTIDCASCHVASRAKSNAEAQRSVDESTLPDVFTSPAPRFDLHRTDGAKNDPRALRAFGYFGGLTALSQRTINESAVIAEALTHARASQK